MKKDNAFIKENEGKLSYLPPREQKILRMLYGIEQEPVSIETVAVEFGVSVRRIETARKRGVTILTKLEVET